MALSVISVIISGIISEIISEIIFKINLEMISEIILEMISGMFRLCLLLLLCSASTIEAFEEEVLSSYSSSVCD